MIDETTGQAAIAYVGKTPWHGLGTELRSGCTVAQWTEAAGLDYVVERSPVQFQRKATPVELEESGPPPSELDVVGVQASFKGRDVLYRTDTGAPLWVASKSYNIVQPSEVMEFFAKLTEIGGFELETAGALSDGKRIWGLARVNDGAPVVGQDVVRPYVLLATSYDGTLATTAKLTSVRVVCNNTLSISVGGEFIDKMESDTEGRAVSTMVRIPHSTTFDGDAVRKQLGIFADCFEKWMIETQLLVERKLAEPQFDRFLEKLLEPLQPKTVHGKPPKPIREGRPFQRVREIYNDALIGAELSGKDNRWAALNAVTQWVDWERGRNQNSRLDGAWFGVGGSIKDRAFSLLTSADEFADA